MERYAFPQFANSMSDTSIDRFDGGLADYYSCSSSDISRTSGDSSILLLQKPFPKVDFHHHAHRDGSYYHHDDNTSYISCSSDSHNSSEDSYFLQTNCLDKPLTATNEIRCNNSNATNSSRAARYRVYGLGSSFKLRNPSVSSPTPQQVSWKLAPFVHVGPSSWKCQSSSTGIVSASPHPGAENIYSRRRSSSSSKSALSQLSCCRESQPSVYEPRCPAARRAAEAVRPGPPSRLHLKPRPRPRLSTTCEDPRSELLRNGRDVDIDAVDVMQMRMRASGQLKGMESGDIIGSGQMRAARCGATGAKTEPLKSRLAQIRALIREVLAERAASDESRGFHRHGAGRSRKDRQKAFKCKFCLSKKEDEDIVTSHNLFDDKGLVDCPILQQYECELCHATGRYAHTLKYCPENNPDTPHDVILQARLKVMLRNRCGQ